MKYPVFKDLIIFENEDYIIINKPPFLATLEDRALNSTNVLRLARQYNPDAQACHRLDKETSGALALAKNNEAYRHLSMQFEHREVTKLYHAVVWGAQDYEGLLVDRAIQPGLKGTAKLTRSGKPAQTYFKTLEKYSRHTLVACKPVTGRMHQIRLHLAYLNAPIVSDTLYGGEHLYLSNLKKNFNLSKDSEEQPFIKRFALHSFQLGFTNLQGEPLLIEAPYPKDFQVLIKMLRQHK
ncbi:RluA family pseudouridine synthase [Adhaeribacter aquaticus]|uniref:RluA family pseudouridine synthase n=1 Tax=Adhaeribacter aquaticus TaxID=299567 RepID=UPI00041E021C|nr:RluA family pseudouridine synthase [Adhaeribacter aquaticus]